MYALADRAVRSWAGPGITGPSGHLLSRWLFLRALGVIYFSAFYSLLFQIRGLLGPQGLLPAASYLANNLVDLANQGGGTDNTTVVAIRCY